MRSTVTDIARESGVSSATVDRVLNGRPGVRERTRIIVMETARKLGYFAPNEDLSEKLRMDFVIPFGTNTFMYNFRQQIERQCATLGDIDLHIHAVEGFNPTSLAKTLTDLKSETRAIALVALDHPVVREAIRTLVEHSVKVVTLVSDILHVQRTGYVGIDNRAAGRLAGYLVGRLLPKGETQEVALFAGSLSYRGHEEREMGFRHVIAEEFPHLNIVELREISDDRQKAYSEAKALLARHPKLAAIYNIGAGNSGIGQALAENSAEKSIVFIGHELTVHSKTMLLNGTMDAVIDQNPRVEAREAIAMLRAALTGNDVDYHPPRIQVVFKENIPET